MFSAASDGAESAVYRRVWRWHFYAGLVCLPFLALMALTGALYLFKDSLEPLAHARVFFTGSPPAEPRLEAQVLVARALAAEPGEPLRYVPPPSAGRSAEVGVLTPRGPIGVFLDPSTGQVIGRVPDSMRLMEVVKQLHSLAIAGPVGNHWVEIVTGWAIVLVVSGVFLWWPRGHAGSALRVRGRPAQRTWWRDLHAVTGVAAGAAIVFLAVTGMPWSAFWGEQFGRLAGELGIGRPLHLFVKPPSPLPAATRTDAPWVLAHVPAPASDPHARHGASPAAAGPARPALPALGAVPASITLDQALRTFAGLRIPPDTPIGLPVGPQGVYTAMVFPGDVRQERVVHLDRYSGTVLTDVGYADYGAAGLATAWGVSLHTGRQFGLANQLVMLAGCLAILLLAGSAVVMWWKRRPRGRLAAPPRREGDRAARAAVAVAALLGLLYPLLGLSMLVALLLDALVPQRWHQRFGL